MTDPLLSTPLLREGIKLRHMRLAVALADLRQVGMAADRIGLTQPAASRALSELETIIGAPFCQRGPRGVTLTPLGEAFARRARRVLIELSSASEELAFITRGEQGKVRIGAVTAPSVSIVTPVLEVMSDEFPNFRSEVIVGTSNELAQELIDGRLDFALCRVPERHDPQQFDATLLNPEGVSLVARSDHPLAGQTVPAKDLVDQRWVMQPLGTPLRRTVDSHFLGQGLTPPDVMLSTTSLLLHVSVMIQSNAIAAVASDVADLLIGERLGRLGLAEIRLPVRLSVEPFSMLRLRGRELLPVADLAFRRVVDFARADRAATTPGRAIQPE